MYVKDLLRSLLLKKFDVKKVLQEPWFVPETTSLLGQLNEFREKQKQMAFVVDEYGVLLGLVTLEDILEEIVGQIEDEHDYPSSNLLYDNNGNIYVNGNVTIRDLNRKFNFKLPENSASTIAGLIINTAKRIPETGENFVIKNLIINIIARSQTRITKVLIKKNKT
jgi:Mg2+/Co2+ transporter CorB